MTLRIAINGFGRIGRLVLRKAVKDPDMEVVAINDLADASTLAHLLVYDSIYGKFDLPVKVVEGGFEVDGKFVKVLSSKSPEGNVWGDLGVDLVYESTGVFATGPKAKVHLDAGAKWVMITAPAKEVDATIVYGVNHKILDPQKHKIFSNASCTTNCLAPVVKVIHDKFGVEQGLLNTVHSVTNDQRILDLVHKDLRRARAATMSMIPTTTGAAKALGLVLPELKGKLDGFSLRVPTMTVSCCDFTFTTRDPISAESLNAAFREAAAGALKGILEVCDLPLVSVDFSGSAASSTVDALSTMVLGDRFGKVLSWYDNEFGYATRCIDVGKLLKK
jgi:glyceraldehyde 3-phosphate dehydrogenase